MICNIGKQVQKRLEALFFIFMMLVFLALISIAVLSLLETSSFSNREGIDPETKGGIALYTMFALLIILTGIALILSSIFGFQVNRETSLVALYAVNDLAVRGIVPVQNDASELTRDLFTVVQGLNLDKINLALKLLGMPLGPKTLRLISATGTATMTLVLRKFFLATG